MQKLKTAKMIAKIVLVSIVLYFVYTFLRFKYVLYYATTQNFEQKESTEGQGPSLRYIAAGDSTAVGVGASSIESSYAYKVFKKLSQQNTVAYKNVGITGAKTQDVIDKELNDIILYNPDVVTISIGANDLTHLVGSDEIIGHYKRIISELTNKTRAQIYITDIPAVQNAKLLPWWYRNLIDQKANRLNEQILALETTRVKIVDIHNFGWGHYSNIQATFASDHFHPSDLGYQNWTDAFLDQIAKKQ